MLARACGAERGNHARTAAGIHEAVHYEDETGWIIGATSGSAAAATACTDDAWDELVLDSGPVSTACPYAWCSNKSVDDNENVYLKGIQQCRIPIHGTRVVPQELK